MQILEVIVDLEGSRGWKLANTHVQTLIQIFPESEDILKCLLTLEEQVNCHHDWQRARLAYKLAEARQEAEDRAWGPKGEMESFTELEVTEQTLAAPVIQLRAQHSFFVQYGYEQIQIFTLEIQRDPDGEPLAIA